MQDERRIKAVQRGLCFLEAAYQERTGYQCFVSSTPDMLHPVSSPEAYLYPGLQEFPAENFSNMVIFELVFRDQPGSRIGHAILNNLRCKHRCGIFPFFQTEGLLPPEVDSTSLGVSILAETGNIEDDAVKHAVGKILANTNQAGVIEVYFPPSGHRHYVDPVVCVNALYLLTLVGRAQEASKTADYIADHLCSQAYLAGTRYYSSADLFLYFGSRLVERFPQQHARFGQLLRQAIQARRGATNTPLDAAARLIAAKRAGVSNEVDERTLLLAQVDDGGWPADAFYTFGRRHGYFGGREVTTAFAVNALA